MFHRMKLHKNSQDHFSVGEYILADSAYSLSTNCILAYKALASNVLGNAEFNFCLARSRIRNEHYIGLLKSRWASLREMRQQIRCPQDMREVVCWVAACCVLHNMLARLGDAWKDMHLEEGD